MTRFRIALFVASAALVALPASALADSDVGEGTTNGKLPRIISQAPMKPLAFGDAKRASGAAKRTGNVRAGRCWPRRGGSRRSPRWSPTIGGACRRPRLRTCRWNRQADPGRRQALRLRGDVRRQEVGDPQLGQLRLLAAIPQFGGGSASPRSRGRPGGPRPPDVGRSGQRDVLLRPQRGRWSTDFGHMFFDSFGDTAFAAYMAHEYGHGAQNGSDPQGCDPLHAVSARASPTAWRAAGCTGCTPRATPTASGAATPRSSTGSCAAPTPRRPSPATATRSGASDGLLRLELRHAGLPQLGALRQLAVATRRHRRSAPAAPSRRGGGPLLPPTTPVWLWSLIESHRRPNAQAHPRRAGGGRRRRDAPRGTRRTGQPGASDTYQGAEFLEMNLSWIIAPGTNTGFTLRRRAVHAERRRDVPERRRQRPGRSHLLVQDHRHRRADHAFDQRRR